MFPFFLPVVFPLYLVLVNHDKMQNEPIQTTNSIFIQVFQSLKAPNICSCILASDSKLMLQLCIRPRFNLCYQNNSIFFSSQFFSAQICIFVVVLISMSKHARHLQFKQKYWSWETIKSQNNTSVGAKRRNSFGSTRKFSTESNFYATLFSHPSFSSVSQRASLEKPHTEPVGRIRHAPHHTHVRPFPNSPKV